MSRLWLLGFTTLIAGSLGAAPASQTKIPAMSQSTSAAAAAQAMAREPARVPTDNLRRCTAADLGPTAPQGAARSAGFDAASRQPYFETRLPDGEVRWQRADNVLVIFKPGRPPATCSIPDFFVRMATQSGTPPELPADPLRGRGWLEKHNADLLNVIRELVHNNETTMNSISRAESEDAGSDLFNQITYRTTIAHFYAKPQP